MFGIKQSTSVFGRRKTVDVTKQPRTIDEYHACLKSPLFKENDNLGAVTPIAMKAFEIRESAQQFLADNKSPASPQANGQAGYSNLLEFKLIDQVTEN